MNEEIQKRLVEAMDEVGKHLKQGAGFVEDQAPLVVDEIVRWGIVQHTAGILLGLAMVVVGALVIRVCLKCFNDKDDSEHLIFATALSVFAVLVGLIILLVNIHHLLRVLTAPRLYVISQITELFP